MIIITEVTAPFTGIHTMILSGDTEPVIHRITIPFTILSGIRPGITVPVGT